MKMRIILSAAIVLLFVLGTAQAEHSASHHAMKWCVTTDSDKSTCDIVATEMNKYNVTGHMLEITCTLPPSSHSNCMDALASKDVDMASNIDGASVFEYHRSHGVKVAAAEGYSTGASVAATYYAVAAVKTADCQSGAIQGLASLKGKRSCHTGYQKSAGWVIPLSRLLSSNVMELAVSEDSSIPNDMLTASNFFSGGSCAPMKTADFAQTQSTLCKNCGTAKGQEGHCCRGDKNDCPGSDLYYGYDGAFRCLVEGNGDVAFVKHTTIPRNTQDGDNYASSALWSWPNDASKFNTSYSLLCPDSMTCASPEDYLSCNLGKVPSHAVLTHSDVSDHKIGLLGQVFELLNTNPIVTATIFSDTAADTDLFKPGTKKFIPNSKTTHEFLGNMIEVYDKNHIMNNAQIGVDAAQQKKKDDNQDDDIVALIIVVSCVSFMVACLVGVVAFMIVREKRGSPYFQVNNK